MVVVNKAATLLLLLITLALGVGDLLFLDIVLLPHFLREQGLVGDAETPRVRLVQPPNPLDVRPTSQDPGSRAGRTALGEQRVRAMDKVVVEVDSPETPGGITLDSGPSPAPIEAGTAGAGPMTPDPPLDQREHALPPIRFERGQSVLGAEARATLDRVAKHLKARTGWTLLVAGHCSTESPVEDRMALSLDRAHAVARYLAERGLPTDRLTVRSFGSKHPWSGQEAPTDPALDRRVELRIQTMENP